LTAYRPAFSVAQGVVMPSAYTAADLPAASAAPKTEAPRTGRFLSGRPLLSMPCVLPLAIAM
jgi:hypothetical protein